MKKLVASIMVGLLCLLAVWSCSLQDTVCAVGGLPKLAVTPKDYDRMQDVLGALGYTYTDIQKADLANLLTLKLYDVVFINCADAYSPVESTFGPIRDFVNGGGAIYASDWAYKYLEGAFPSYVNFSGKIAPTQKVTGTVIDADLRAFLGVNEFEIDYDLIDWVPVSKVSSQVQVYVTNNVEYNLEMHNNVPTVVGFKYGNGYVAYTSFHNAAQDIVARKLMQYLVLLTVTSDIRTSLEGIIGQKGMDVRATYTDMINKGATITHNYTVQKSTSLLFAVNWFGSEMKLSVFKPDGTLYSSSSSLSPPIIIEVPNADPGVWNYSIQAVDVPFLNYPVVSMTGTPKAGGLGVFELLLLVIIAGAAIAVVVGVAVILYKRKRPITPPTQQVLPPPPPPPPPPP